MILEHLLTDFLFRFTCLEVTECVMVCVFVLIAQKLVFNATGLLQHTVPVFNFVWYTKKNCFRFGYLPVRKEPFVSVGWANESPQNSRRQKGDK